MGTVGFGPSPALGPVNWWGAPAPTAWCIGPGWDFFHRGIMPAADLPDDWGRADRYGLSAGLQAEFDLPQPGLAHGHRATQTGAAHPHHVKSTCTAGKERDKQDTLLPSFCL